MLCYTRQLIKGSEKPCSKDTCVVLLFIWWNSIKTPIWSTLTAPRGSAGEPILSNRHTIQGTVCAPREGLGVAEGADFFSQFIFNWRIIALGQTFACGYLGQTCFLLPILLSPFLQRDHVGDSPGRSIADWEEERELWKPRSGVPWEYLGKLVCMCLFGGNTKI